MIGHRPECAGHRSGLPARSAETAPQMPAICRQRPFRLATIRYRSIRASSCIGGQILRKQ
jgi:hypothetical protein